MNFFQFWAIADSLFNVLQFVAEIGGGIGFSISSVSIDTFLALGVRIVFLPSVGQKTNHL